MTPRFIPTCQHCMGSGRAGKEENYGLCRACGGTGKPK
jgi:hypothetical protein